MTKRKGSGPPVESRDSKAARIHATAMAIVESDALRMRSNTERLRALRLAKEAAEVRKRTDTRKAE